jgi:predicted nucleotidyltransferase
MPIPPLDEDGLLPEGIHECSLEEIRARFGSFQASDQRPRLFAKLGAFLRDAEASKAVVGVLVNGSFVTGKARPNDIDLIVVVPREHDFLADLSPGAYNVLSKRRVRQRFGFDLLVAREGSIEYERWTEFFQEVRLEPGRRKGILKLRL